MIVIYIQSTFIRLLITQMALSTLVSQHFLIIIGGNSVKAFEVPIMEILWVGRIPISAVTVSAVSQGALPPDRFQLEVEC